MKFKFLKFCPQFYRLASGSCEPQTSSNSLLRSLISKIKLFGPITVHEYMRESLTNVEKGYYMTKDVFGKSGDFITSPEISQIFGEMVAVWMLNEWEKLGRPKPFQLVELGPGRGTMMQDILRVYSRLGQWREDELSVELVEVSPELRQIQAATLGCQSLVPDASSSHTPLSRISSSGLSVRWHDSVNSLPDKFSCIIAHEFFDALPIHILKKTEDGWKEVLVDADETGDKLRFVLSKGPTPACIYSKYANGRDYFEISPGSGVVMEELTRRMEEFGGIALVIDYGHNGDKTDTFRGFRRHKMVEPLSEPGTSDLTADVDFSFLKSVAGGRLLSFGPVSQRHFLSQLHIHRRLEMLLKTCESESLKKDILSGYQMIMDPDKMGDCFKVVAFFPAVLQRYFKQYPVTGFL